MAHDGVRMAAAKLHEAGCPQAIRKALDAAHQATARLRAPVLAQYLATLTP
jgi:hypothetical protein